MIKFVSLANTSYIITSNFFKLVVRYVYYLKDLDRNINDDMVRCYVYFFLTKAIGCLSRKVCIVRYRLYTSLESSGLCVHRMFSKEKERHKYNIRLFVEQLS